MRLNIRHRTAYHYDVPIASAVQTLRLAPQPHKGLSVLRWHVRGDAARELPSYVDGYGNIVHSHTVHRPHVGATILVEGEVETLDTDGVMSGTPETLPPVFFLRRTPLTSPCEAIATLADLARREATTLDRLHAAMALVRGAIDYRTGATEATTTAAEAMAKGAGVCQDHAHVFITVARLLGVPARYVSGYLFVPDEQGDQDACHAWAEAYVEDLGWVGFDPSNRVCPTDSYVRTAAGLDYWSAAPVRGLWQGKASEHLLVEVHVRQPGYHRRVAQQ